jgi:threonine/homoserine/homoserine lactone efflux protein
MMALETWLAFIVASAVMLVIPGPTILLVMQRALAGGRGAALPLVLGVAAGDLTAICLSLAGLGALLATSAELFALVRYAGAAYLIWLGVKMWRTPISFGGLSAARGMTAMRDAYIVTALKPKAIIFFVAFVPAFLDPAKPFLPQALVLIVSFVTMAAANALFYALVAARLSGKISRPGAWNGFNRLGGGVLMGAGIATAFMRR